jgi:transcriptional regulator of met regulon
VNEPSSKDRTAKKLTIGKELAVTELATEERTGRQATNPNASLQGRRI